MSPHAPQLSLVTMLGQCRVTTKRLLKGEHDLPAPLTLKHELAAHSFQDCWPEAKSNFLSQTSIYLFSIHQAGVSYNRDWPGTHCVAEARLYWPGTHCIGEARLYWPGIHCVAEDRL